MPKKSTTNLQKCNNCPYPYQRVCYGKDINPCDFDLHTVAEQIRYALQELYREHRYLIDVRANEVSIAAQFLYCFKQAF